MFGDMRNHLSHYLILFSIFAFGFFFFFLFQHNPQIQGWFIIAIAVAYFLWGIVHHYLEKSLYWKVVVEYFLIALLGAILALSLIYRA